MGFLSKVPGSWKKSSRLKRLQKTIAPLHQRVSEVASDLMCLLEKGETSERERALEKLFDLCESDDTVRAVCWPGGSGNGSKTTMFPCQRLRMLNRSNTWFALRNEA
jgi:hypothetical protein